MLYDNDNEVQDFKVMDEFNKIYLRKKVIVCGIIILCCIIIMIIGIGISVKNKDQKPKVAEKKLPVYDGTHMQIEKHNVDQMKNNFIPIQTSKSQAEITNMYYQKEKVAYLTFDDGPSKSVTPQILDILKQEKVPATFFVVGARVELNPDIAKRIYDEGHYLANHGYSHKYSKIYTSKDTVFEEYIKCENAIRNALGNQCYNTYLFRFPGGLKGGKYADIKAEAAQMINSYGIKYIDWNCLTGDAEGKNTSDEQLEYLITTKRRHETLIVLMHDATDKQVTVESLPKVIAYLRENGYTFKNFFEIF